MQNRVVENTVVRGPIMSIIDWVQTSPSICILSLEILNLQYLTYYCTDSNQTKNDKKKQCKDISSSRGIVFLRKQTLTETARNAGSKQRTTFQQGSDSVA